MSCLLYLEDKIIATQTVRRFCVLSAYNLSYYVDESKRELRGDFQLSCTTFQLGWKLRKKKSPTPNVFTISTKKRQYYFCCNGHGEALDWSQAYTDAEEFRKEVPEEVGGSASASGGSATHVDEIERQYNISDESMSSDSDSAIDEGELRKVNSASTISQEFPASPKGFGGMMPPIDERYSKESFSEANSSPRSHHQRSKHPGKISISVRCEGVGHRGYKNVAVSLPERKLETVTVKDIKRALLKKLGKPNAQYATLYVNGGDAGGEDKWKALHDRYTVKEAGIEPLQSLLRLAVESYGYSNTSSPIANTASPASYGGTPSSIDVVNYDSSSPETSPQLIPKGQKSGTPLRPRENSDTDSYSCSVTSYTNSNFDTPPGQDRKIGDLPNGDHKGLSPLRLNKTSEVDRLISNLFDSMATENEGCRQVAAKDFIDSICRDRSLQLLPEGRVLTESIGRTFRGFSVITWKEVEKFLATSEVQPHLNTKKASKVSNLDKQTIEFALEKAPAINSETAQLDTELSDSDYGDEKDAPTVLLKIYIRDSEDAKLYLRAGDNAEDLAVRFIEKNGLDYESFYEPLVSEITQGLLEAYRLENQAIRSARAGATRRLEVAQRCICALLNGEEGSFSIEKGISDRAAQLANECASQFQLLERERDAALQTKGRHLTEKEEHKVQALSRRESERKPQTEEHTQVKRNDDYENVLRDNNRLRAALSPHGHEMDQLLKNLESDSSMLRAELSTATEKISRLERELQGVYVQWNADHETWSKERDRLSSQVRTLTSMLSTGSSHSTDIKEWQDLLLQSQELIVALESDKKTILSEWADEFSQIASLVKWQSEWWKDEQQNLSRQCDEIADVLLKGMRSDSAAGSIDIASLLTKIRGLRASISAARMMDEESLHMLSSDRPRTPNLSMVHNGIARDSRLKSSKVMK